MMASRWAGVVVRRPWWVVAVFMVAMAGAAVVGVGTLNDLSLSRFAAAGSESDHASDRLAELADVGAANVVLLVRPEVGTVDSDAAAAAGTALTAELGSYPGVRRSWSYWSEDRAATMRSDSGDAAWVYAWVPGDADTVRGQVLPGLVEKFGGRDETLNVAVAGADEVFRQVAEQSRRDFLRAEMIIVPLVLALLWLIYRRFRAAAVTLLVGFGAVVGALALLRIVVQFTEVSTFASNIVLVLGIGLGVDYGLFMIYRFREELAGGLSPRAAAVRTVQTAGRTVMFSGVTVAAALSVLLVFPYPFLSSFAWAGLAVVVSALLCALVALPAALVLLGSRVVRRHPNTVPAQRTLWFRLPAAVMARPRAWGGLGAVIVLALIAPVAAITFGVADDRVLPADASVRQVYDVERASFTAQDSDALLMVADRHLDADEQRDYAAAISRVGGIARVDTAHGSFAAGQLLTAATAPRLAGDGPLTWISATPTSNVLAENVGSVVREVRAVPAPTAVDVGGYPAELIDYRDGVASYLPLVVALIVAVTVLVLFLMTGSVIMPIIATGLNLLSMGVMFAALVWGFQGGGLSWLTGFTPTGSIEPSIPILMFCIAYGLSMDYSVFLIARIKENYDRTGDPIASVPAGIAHSGPLVSAAALTLAASFLVYATSGIVFLQQLGIGMAIAVIIDATVIRGLLLPAALRLAGNRTWWAPAPLRQAHNTIKAWS